MSVKVTVKLSNASTPKGAGGTALIAGVALDNTPDFTYTFDREGRFTFVNRALLSLWQKTLDEAVGKNFLELGYPAALAGRLQRQIQEVIDTAQPLCDQTEFTGPTGETRDYEYIFVPVLGTDAEVEAVAGSTRDVTERNRVEKRIEEDRQRWRDLLHQAPAAIAVFRGPEHRFEWFNDGYLGLIGRSADAIRGKCLAEVLPETEAQGFINLLDQVYRSGEPFRGHEFLYRADDGDAALHDRYVNFVYAATRDSSGSIDGIFVHATDVTSIVLARKRVEESEQRFRMLVESATDHAIVGLDTAGRITDWNAGAERLLGFRKHEVLGQPVTIFRVPEDREITTAETELVRACELGHSSDEHWHLKKDGTRFWGSGTVTPVRDHDSRLLGFVKVFHDGTKEREASEAARQSEHIFRQLANSTPQMVWTARADGWVDYFNERWYHFTRQDRNLRGDESWVPLLHPEDASYAVERWRSCVHSGQPYQTEYRLWDVRDRRWRWFMVRALAVRDERGEIVKWFGSSTDIDEQKQGQLTLLQEQKLESIGLLAGGIAHDFNNLLAGILGWSSLAMDTVAPNHPAFSMLESVVAAGERAAHLTRQMLAYAGKARLAIEPIDLSTIVRHTAELISASIPKAVRIHLRLAEDMPVIQTDGGQMQQLAMNLMMNAAEAIGDDREGTIVVRTFPEEIAAGGNRCDVFGTPIRPALYAVLQVQDTGCGIDSTILSSIFDPFFTTKFTGRGLGLASVSGIVRSQQGAIEVLTEKGRGATFRVLFPADRAESNGPDAPDDQADQEKKTILVIDDEAVIRDLMKAILDSAGYRTLVVPSGQKGLETIRQNGDISLVLLDMSMPEMSGRQVLETLYEGGSTVPVIICSGYSGDDVFRRFCGLELAGVLQKPFTVSGLLEEVRAVLDSEVQSPG